MQKELVVRRLSDRNNILGTFTNQSLVASLSEKKGCFTFDTLEVSERPLILN
jgi:hypothetical protein